MIGDRNFIYTIRKMISAVRSVKMARMWKMYMAVACLCVALTMMFAVHATLARYRETPAAQKSGLAFKPQEPSLAVKALEMPPDLSAAEDLSARAKEAELEKAAEKSSESASPAAPSQAADETKPIERASSPEPAAAKQPKPAAAKSAPREKIEGEWYYSETHKDWRFRRK